MNITEKYLRSFLNCIDNYKNIDLKTRSKEAKRKYQFLVKEISANLQASENNIIFLDDILQIVINKQTNQKPCYLFRKTGAILPDFDETKQSIKNYYSENTRLDSYYLELLARLEQNIKNLSDQGVCLTFHALLDLINMIYQEDQDESKKYLNNLIAFLQRKEKIKPRNIDGNIATLNQFIFQVLEFDSPHERLTGK